jgi:dTDP-4-dehydrorhamnose reductase
MEIIRITTKNNIMNNPQVIGIGLNGLVGSRIVQVLDNEIDFVSLSKSNGIDITKPETLASINDYPNADFVLLLAAKTDVDSCEKDKELDHAGDAWKINVEGVFNVAKVAEEVGKKLIYVSTDFVFEGEKNEGDSYGEEDTPNPLNWYGLTKYEGEKRVEESGADYLIVRPAYPFRAEFEVKKDFFRFIKERLETGIETKMVTDHIFCPTFIDDFAIALKKLIDSDATGTYHAVGGESITPYEAALKIAEVFELDKNLILKTTREEFFKDRAPRPFNLSLSNAKIEKLGVKMRGFEESLQVIKSQLQ